MSKELITSRGSHEGCSQRSGSNTSNQNQLASPRGVSTKHTMEGLNNTLRIP